MKGRSSIEQPRHNLVIKKIDRLQETKFCHQILDNFFLIFKEGSEFFTRVVNIDPAVARTYSFPFWCFVHFAKRDPIGIGQIQVLETIKEGKTVFRAERTR